MALKGNLQTIDLTTIFQLLETDKKTGILQVKNEGKTINVFIKDGAIAYATDAKADNRLGYLLRSSQVITDEQLESSLRLCSENNVSLGKVLVDNGYISQEILHKFIFKQAENLVFDLFFWKDGSFEYKDVSISPDKMLFKKISIMQILLEASRRIDEMDVIKKQIPSDALIFKKSDREGTVLDALNDQERPIFALVNGEYTVRQLVDKSGCDEYTGYKIINSLIVSASIELCEGIVPEKNAEERNNLQLEPENQVSDNGPNTGETQTSNTGESVQAHGPEDGELPDAVSEDNATNMTKNGISNGPQNPTGKMWDPIARFFVGFSHEKKRILIIAASIIGLFIIISGSLYFTRHLKNKRIKDAYRAAILQAENQSELANKEKVLRDYLKATQSNSYTRDVENRLKEIEKLIEQKDFELTLSNADDLYQKTDYAEAKEIYQHYLAQYPKTNHAKELTQRIAEVDALIEDKDFEKLDEIVADDYRARISAYDLYLKNHPEGKHKQMVLAFIEKTVEEYCMFFRKQVEAGNNIAMDDLILNGHKEKVVSTLTDFVIPPEKNQILDLLEKGHEELKNKNFKEAVKCFEQSLSVVHNSQLSDLKMYKHYEKEILTALENSDLVSFKKGFLQFKDEWYAPEEYEKIIQAHGYVKDEGSWYSPEEYEELMISRGYFKYNGKYLTKSNFLNQAIKPVLRNKSNIEKWQDFDSIELKLKKSDRADMIYAIIAVSGVSLKDYKVVETMKMDAVFNRDSDQWRFINLNKESSLIEYE